MDATILQTQWGPLVAIYLFLGGLAGGTLLVSSIISLKWPKKFQRTATFGAWAGAILLAAGVLCLLLETTMPARAMMLWQSFSNITSWMAIGAWLLFITIIIAFIYAIFQTDAIAAKFKTIDETKLAQIRKVFAWICCVLGSCVAIYTGILLCVLVAHPLWNTFLIPALFTVSAFDTGVALVLGFMVLREDRETEDFEKVRTLLEKSTVVLVVVELVVLAILLATVAGATEVGAMSVGLLTTGSLAIWFWGLLIFCGLVCPLAISIFVVFKHNLASDKAKALALTGSVLCLIGGCTLRFLILLAGLPVYV